MIIRKYSGTGVRLAGQFFLTFYISYCSREVFSCLGEIMVTIMVNVLLLEFAVQLEANHTNILDIG